jgi:citrate synthase
MSTTLQKDSSMTEVAKLIVDNAELELPIIVGTEDEKAVDIAKLRNETGFITLDEGYMNTGATLSAITFLDGEKGILRYRGYPVEQLAEKCDFVEVAYLLIYGELPDAAQLETFRSNLRRHTMLHEDMRLFYDGFPRDAHPMAILSSVCGALSTFYQDSLSSKDPEQVDKSILRLMAKLPTIAAYAHKKSIGQPFVYPRNDLTYCENFLRMMFAVPTEPFEADPDFVDALNLLLIIHADHEQNCSTSTVRMVGSSDANLFASISAGICALWGPLHGGANEACVAMLQQIANEGGNVTKFVEKVKEKNSGVRLMGFGHRVYKSYDPRAKIIKSACDKLLAKRHINDPIFEIAKQLEEVALSDEYFIERKLYPNVDFYSGVVYRAMGIPVPMFTVLFALGRLPGWISHWIEMRHSPGKKICRPRQIYTGPKKRDFVPIEKRG